MPLNIPDYAIGEKRLQYVLPSRNEWLFREAEVFVNADIHHGAASFDVTAKPLITRLAHVFHEFFHLTAAEWEANLAQADNPSTLLALWKTAADVFDYYTRDKKLPWGARADYFRLVLGFFHHVPLTDHSLWSLTPGRAARVHNEMTRYFHRPRWDR